eukprot:scaffold66003_cov63-Phaeocystis_antarctica.AAC.2
MFRVIWAHPLTPAITLASLKLSRVILLLPRSLANRNRVRFVPSRKRDRLRASSVSTSSSLLPVWKTLMRSKWSSP